MRKENEQSIITSSGLDNEIRELCNTENFLKALTEGTPMGSCEWMTAKAQLVGVRRRLVELGIDEVHGEERT